VATERQIEPQIRPRRRVPVRQRRGPRRFQRVTLNERSYKEAKAELQFLQTARKTPRGAGTPACCGDTLVAAASAARLHPHPYRKNPTNSDTFRQCLQSSDDYQHPQLASFRKITGRL